MFCISDEGEGSLGLIRYSCRYKVFDAFVDLCKSMENRDGTAARGGERGMEEERRGRKREKKRGRSKGSGTRKDGKTNDTRLHDNFESMVPVTRACKYFTARNVVVVVVVVVGCCEIFRSRV